MPPVRWKLLAVAAICLAHISTSAKKERQLVEDGWRPIVGHRDPSYSDEITQYRNPSSLEAVKVEKNRPSTSEPILPPQSPPPKPTVSTPVNNINNQHYNVPKQHVVKVPPHTKHQHFHFGPNQGHVSQIPMNLMTHRSQNKPYKMPVMGKTHAPMFSGKRPIKPVRVQVGAHSARDEIFAAAPSSAIGSYAYFTQGQSPVKTRLGQPHSHFDFINRFAPNEEIFQFQRLPVQQYVLPKYPIPNDVHYTFQAQNDEYTRNLVPPLPSKQFQDKDKQSAKPIFKQKEQPVTEQVQVTKSSAEQVQTSVIPESILVQVPPPYQPQAYYITNQNQNPEQTVDVQVTKEKLKVFHNNIPPNYNPQNDFASFDNYQFVKKPSEGSRLPTYEVTEGKVWQQTPTFQFHYTRDPNRTKRPQIVQTQVETAAQFLPTPVKPEVLVPTSPTQGEISTIYTTLSQMNKKKEQEDPSLFRIKDVSTHYPILGKPDFKHQYNVQFSAPGQDIAEYSNEITTTTKTKQDVVDDVETTIIPTKAPSPTTIPTRDWQQKRRPGHRRRKPVSRNRPATEEPETSTDYYESQKSEETETTTPRERRRRPMRYRTTEATPVAEDRPVRTRYRQRPKPTEESMEIPYNHKMTTEYSQKPIRGSYSNYDEHYERTTNREIGQSQFTKFGKYDDNDNVEEYQRPKLRRTRPYPSNEYERPTKYRIKQQSDEERSSEMYSEEQKYSIEEVVSGEDSQEQTELDSDKPSEEAEKPTITVLTTDAAPTTNIRTPENEVDYSTVNPQRSTPQETITIEEIHTQEPQQTEETTTLAMTTVVPTTTTTTTEPTTTKSNRIRRPINYKSSRPRFSVKEYRQRLNQYTSTTTTESTKSTTEAAARNRYPHRSRKPIMRFQQQEIKDAQEEDVTEPSVRTKFVPKSPRYGSTSEPKGEEDVEQTAKTTNSRLRPFGRNRSTTSTTEATTTQKVSIKPNIFSNLRRPPQITLRNRIFNRYNRNNTAEKTTRSPSELESLDNETSEVVESTEELDKQHVDATVTVNKVLSEESTTATTPSSFTSSTSGTSEDDLDNVDILKNEAFLHSQRVSDLTSSAQNDYKTPGAFKSVSSNVRRVPSYFTISTDDPILPIEAFFPNINKEMKDKHKRHV